MGVEELPPYEVVCVELDAGPEGRGHQHVRFIETRDPDGGRTRWSREQALAAIRAGERFVIPEDGNRGSTLIEPGLCPRCPFFTLLVHRPETLPQTC